MLPGLWLVTALAWATPGPGAGAADMATVPGGVFAPPYGQPGEQITVAPFLLDRHAVTNAQFLAFVREHPRWQRGTAPEVFAEGTYLEHWEGPLTLGPGAPPDAPVTSVSWFAARAYCAARGARLPQLDEWEVAARASATSPDASDDPAFQRRVLDSYAKPTPSPLPDVRSTVEDVHGIWDLHGLVWEWVDDFQGVLLRSDARGDADIALTCGAGALGSIDPREYATYLRYAMRAGLEGRFVQRSLGFRCAADQELP